MKVEKIHTKHVYTHKYYISIFIWNENTKFENYLHETHLIGKKMKS